MRNYRLLASVLLISTVLLSGCTRTLEKIKNGKLPTDTYIIEKTNFGNEDVFSMIPIYISNGKTTTINWIPMWSQEKHLRVNYLYRDHIRKLSTDDYDVVKTRKRPFIRVKKGQIGSSNPSVVAYMR
ncbi:hypothetical protein [Levilactobacillus brevis]|uniref:hypothetical protein n=1 Tax=Levilactobacillus brevis TaxID=1580 RepID=UPI002073700D|nr:hypothetical protein [Levilactobacillus brevis]